MERREFFRRGLKKTGETVVKEAARKAEARAAHWIRPPWALDELEFLLACTRCGECEKACPHDVVFGLSARLGASVAGTPALDLLNHGCHLCEDWPCVAACEPGALALPEIEGGRRYWPRLALASIDTGQCLPYQGPECGACRDSCPIDGALGWEGERPVIKAERCSGCGLCREACIMQPPAILITAWKKETKNV